MSAPTHRRVMVTVMAPVDMDAHTVADVIEAAMLGDDTPAPDVVVWEWPAFWQDVADGTLSLGRVNSPGGVA